MMFIVWNMLVLVDEHRKTRRRHFVSVVIMQNEKGDSRPEKAPTKSKFCPVTKSLRNCNVLFWTPTVCSSNHLGFQTQSMTGGCKCLNSRSLHLHMCKTIETNVE